LSPFCARTREELTDIIPASVMAARVEIAATEPARGLLFIMEASLLATSRKDGSISDEIRRSGIAMRRYKTVGEDRVMFVSKSIPSNQDYVEQ
jgi:hypothetical protein